jgi:hypothetical protein
MPEPSDNGGFFAMIDSQTVTALVEAFHEPSDGASAKSRELTC